MLYASKESLEYVEFRFRGKKYDFLEKNTNSEIFPILIQRGGPFGLEAKNSLFLNFQNFRIWKWPQGVLGNVKRNRVLKYELILSVRQGVT